MYAADLSKMTPTMASDTAPRKATWDGGDDPLCIFRTINWRPLQMNTESNNKHPSRCLARLFRRLWPEPDRWETIATGPAEINGLRYEIRSVKTIGTYLHERNQHGQERYIITDPDGTTYTLDASQVSTTNK
jgi:hypothetical protein